MNKYLKYQRGQAIVLIVLGIVGLIGMTALAIDGGNAYSDRRHAQNAADTAAFAAALNKLQGGNLASLQSAGWARAASNGYDNKTTNTVAVNNPPAAGSQYDCTHNSSTFNCNDYIQVIITSHVKTFFAPIVGIPQVTNVVESVAHAKPGNPNLPLYGGNTIVGLAPSGCRTVELCGSAQTQIWGGGVFSNSSDNCGLTIGGGKNTQVTLYDGPFQTVAPGYDTKGNPQVNGSFQGNQTQYPYPPTNLPNPTCSSNGTVSGGTLSPGNYGTAASPQTFPPGNGNFTLKPGTYCVYGDFNLNNSQTFDGTSGVTIVMETGAIHWNGEAQVKIYAPTSGSYPGLAVFAPMSNTSVMVINGKANVDLIGTFLTPASALSYNGTAQIQKHNLQFIGKTVSFCGDLDTQLQYGSSNTAKDSSSPEIQLAK